MRDIPGARSLVLAAAVAAALAAAPPARADTVHLRNGRKLVGTVVREDEKKVILDVPGMGEMTIDRATVKEIVKGALPPAPPKAPAPPAPPAAAPAPATLPPAPSGDSTPSPPQPPAAPAPSRPQPPSAPASRELLVAAPSGAVADVPQSTLAASKAVMDRPGPWKLVPGTCRQTLEHLAQQAGLTVRASEFAAAALEKKSAVRAAGTSDVWFGALATSTVDGTGTNLALRVRGSELHVGRPHEVLGEIPVVQDGALVWPDSRDDVAWSLDPEGWRRPDLVAVSVAARGGRVRIELTFAEDVVATLAQKTPKGTQRAYTLAYVCFDADGDEATGPTHDWDQVSKGWDARVRISTGFEIRQGESTFSQWGDMETVEGAHTVLRTTATYDARLLAGPSAGNGLRIVERHDPETPERLTRIDGRVVSAEIPYDALGLVKGRAARVVVVDALEKELGGDRVSQPGGLEVR